MAALMDRVGLHHVEAPHVDRDVVKLGGHNHRGRGRGCHRDPLRHRAPGIAGRKADVARRRLAKARRRGMMWVPDAGSALAATIAAESNAADRAYRRRHRKLAAEARAIERSAA